MKSDFRYLHLEAVTGYRSYHPLQWTRRSWMRGKTPPHRPPVVVRDELKSGVLVERCRIAQMQESFYAISPSRRFPNPLVRELLAKPLTMRARR